jgi:23S rRNA A2030 N6-methylase RlmJ
MSRVKGADMADTEGRKRLAVRIAQAHERTELFLADGPFEEPSEHQRVVDRWGPVARGEIFPRPLQPSQ